MKTSKPAPEKLLEINNLSVNFAVKADSAVLTAVKNLSATLYKGEILGIVGESGSGKSATALSIPGLLPFPAASYAPESSIKLRGRELIGAAERELQKIRGGKIGFIFQEPLSSLNPLHRIGSQIAEALTAHRRISAGKARSETLKLLETVGIENPELRCNAFPYELSGGQRQRVMIAAAIANKPEILIADEPTTALDVTIQEQIIQLLLSLRKKLNMSIIFISHDLYLVSKIADRIMVMQDGYVVETGTCRQIFENPQHDYTKKLISSCLPLKNHKKIKNESLAIINRIEVEFPLKKNIWGKTLQTLKAVDDVSFTIRRGETLGLAGESGSGKTTLGMCVANLAKYRGRVEISGCSNEKDFRRRVQIVFQDPYNSLNPRFNILESVGEGLKAHYKSLSKTEIKDKAAAILKETGLSDSFLYKYPHELSGGQRQRVALARALVLRPELIVLDEPTSALDVTIQAQIIGLLKEIQQKFNVAYLFISHDLRVMRSLADRIAVMKNGRIVEIGDVEKLLTAPQKEYTRQLLAASGLL